MTLTFVGHACFLVRGRDGTRILLDPYEPGAFGGRISLVPFEEPVDVVVSTHGHRDHFFLSPAFGSPAVLRSTGEAFGIRFDGLELPHGGGTGTVTGFRFEVDGTSVFHPGDLGRLLLPAEVEALGRVDVLLVPVGGRFTIGPDEAVRLVEQLAPAAAIPMHFLAPEVALDLKPLDDFLDCVPRFEQPGGSDVTFDSPPRSPTRILVLEPRHGSLPLRRAAG
jgi:L-ascorbate metabolism protein UlaG (beta-lactamase superfamily)